MILNGEVGKMQYSDISDDEGSKLHDTMETSNTTAEYVTLILLVLEYFW